MIQPWFRRDRARQRRRTAAPAVPLVILLYHSVARQRLSVDDFCFIGEDEFRRQLEALTRRFRIVPLEEAARLLAEDGVREPTAVLTFDDGFQDNFDVVYPLLRAAGAPATIFVCTDLVDSQRALWYCRLHQAITHTPVRQLDWDGRSWDLSDLPARARVASALKEALKRLPHPALEAAVDEIAARLDPDRSLAAEVDPPFRMLTRAAVRELASGGLVEIGAHTASHAILAQLTPAQQRDQIERSVDAVEEMTGRRCRLFAYPNGRFEDYDAITLGILRDAGIAVAVTAEKGWNDATTPPLELLRFAIGGVAATTGFEQVLQRFEGAARARA